MVDSKQQVAVFISCAAVGFIAAFLYFVLRVLRVELKLKKTVPFIDATFWVVVICMSYMALYKSGSGQLRGFAFPGMLCGIIVYIFIFSTFVNRWTVISVRFLRSFLNIMLTPFVKIFGLIMSLMSKIAEIVQNIQKNSKIFVKKRLEKFRKNSIIRYR